MILEGGAIGHGLPLTFLPTHLHHGISLFHRGPWGHERGDPVIGTDGRWGHRIVWMVVGHFSHGEMDFYQKYC